MEHIAMDLGAKESRVCVRSEGGEIVEERRIATRPQTLRRYLEGRAKTRVIVETGPGPLSYGQTIYPQQSHSIRPSH